MDENYYRELIDKVNLNQEAMFRREESQDEGFDDFKELWGIFSDEELDVSAEIFLEAVDLCMTSFFGCMQDETYIWDHIVSYYQQALADPDKEREFRDAFTVFAKAHAGSGYAVCIAQLTNMMHLAINAGDYEIADALIDYATCPELWNSEEEYPEWSVWFAVFTDKDFSEVPHSPKVIDTLNELYSKLGDHPDMDRLRELHDAI